MSEKYFKFRHFVTLKDRPTDDDKAARAIFFNKLTKKKIVEYLKDNDLYNYFGHFEITIYYDELDQYFKANLFYKKDYDDKNELHDEILHYDDFDDLTCDIDFLHYLELIKAKKLKIFKRIG